MSADQLDRNNKEITYMVRDSLSGELLEMRAPICPTCNNPIYGNRAHVTCIRQREERVRMEQAEWQRQQDIKMFGEPLTYQERMARTYPDSKVNGYSETYNQRLERIENERREAELQKVRARAWRKRQLEQMEQDIVVLRRQVTQDTAESDTRNSSSL